MFLPGSVTGVGECHVTDSELVEHPQDGQTAADGVTRLNTDQAGNLLGGKRFLNPLKFYVGFNF